MRKRGAQEISTVSTFHTHKNLRLRNSCKSSCRAQLQWLCPCQQGQTKPMPRLLCLTTRIFTLLYASLFQRLHELQLSPRWTVQRGDQHFPHNPNYTSSTTHVSIVCCSSRNLHVTAHRHSSKYKAGSISCVNLGGFNHERVQTFSEITEN